MGFMKSFFRKRTMTHDEMVSQAYSSYKPEFIRVLFPNGMAQASSVIVSLSKIFRIQLNQLSSEEYLTLLRIYTTTKIRIISPQLTDESTRKQLLLEFKQFINRENVNQVIAFVKISLLNSEFSLLTNSDLLSLSMMASNLDDGESSTEHNNRVAYMFEEDDDYGIVEIKPLYCNEVAGSKAFLSRLVTASEESLKWERIGSKQVDGIMGPVDVYESTLLTGETYGRLYINMYSHTAPKRAPKNYKFKS